MSLWSIQVDAGAVDGLKLQAVMEGNDISEGEMGESAALIVCVCEKGRDAIQLGVPAWTSSQAMLHL